MKTGISIRDDVFEAAERTAKVLGWSRSRLYTKAISDFVARHQRENVTQRLDAVYGGHEAASRLDDKLAQMQSLSLPPDDEE